ncbi:MAG: hypothetical protein ABIG64_07830 [Candidatus Omnitrophota bacterium]
MKSGWIEHKNKKIFFAQFCEFDRDEDAVIAEINFSKKSVYNFPEKSALLLVDVHGTAGTIRVVECLKDTALSVKKIFKKTAVIGVDGFKKVLLRGIVRFSGMEINSFEDIEAAKEWLIQD